MDSFPLSDNMATFKKSYTFSSRSGQTCHTNHDSPFTIIDGSYVIGIDPESTEEELIKWQVDLDYDILSLVSNVDGSVIAVLTDDETLTLLRGRDGTVLVTKQIKPDSTEKKSLLLSEGIKFVRNSDVSSIKDVLIIPSLIHDMKEEFGCNLLSVLVVCGIDGQALNEDSIETSRNALRQMSKRTFQIELPSTLNKISLINACFVDEKMIRFLIADQHGSVYSYDYDILEKKDLIPVEDSLDLNFNGDLLNINEVLVEEKWSIDTSMGCDFDLNCGDIFTILVAKSNCGRTNICWFDLRTLNLSGLYELNEGGYNVKSNLLCFKAIHSPDNSASVAMVVESTESLLPKKMIVIQGCFLSSTPDDKGPIEDASSKEIANTQVIFEIPIKLDEMFTGKHHLSGIIFTNKDHYAFSCRLQNHNYSQCWHFSAGKEKLLGQIKLLLSSGCFDEASQALANMPNHHISGEYGSVHISEVALWNFKYMLQSNTLLSRDGKEELRDVFGRLARNAVSDVNFGRSNLLNASRALRQWSKINRSNLGDGLQIRDFRMVLCAMQANVTNAMKLLDRCTLLEKELMLLEAKINCLKCIEAILGIGKDEVPLGRVLGLVDSISQLYSLLIREGAFDSAEQVRRYDAGKFVGPREIGFSIGYISRTIHPYKYCMWLQTVAIPILVFSNESMDQLKVWGLTTADYFDQDQSHGIDASILLLETIVKSILDSSVDKHLCFSSTFSVGRRKQMTNHQLESDCIQMKLLHAKVLKEARALGLPSDEMRLESFSEDGGAEFCAKHLIRISCESNGIDSFSRSSSKTNVENFCQRAGVSFSRAVLNYANDLCESKQSFNFQATCNLVCLCSDPEIKGQLSLKILQTALISHVNQEDFKSFSSEAIECARHETIKSELQEVTRLLFIDSIVRRYCGSKSAELFRVSDQLHSHRLLAHISRYVDVEDQLDDVLFLCDSFTHLNKFDACLMILEKVILASSNKLVQSERSEYCEKIFLTLLNLDPKSAISIALKLCNFCSEVTTSLQKRLKSSNHPNHEEFKQEYISCCIAITEIESVITMYFNNHFDDKSFELELVKSYSKDFHKMHKLLQEFGLILSISDFVDHRMYQHIAGKIIKVSLYSWMNKKDKNSDSDLKQVLEVAKRGVFLLCGDNAVVAEPIWCNGLETITSSLIQSNHEIVSLKLIEYSGMLNNINNQFMFHTLFSTVTRLCTTGLLNSGSHSILSSSRLMRRFVMGGLLLRDHLIMNCSGSLLSSVMFLHNAIDLVSQIILRTDCGIGEEMHSFKSTLYQKSQSLRSLTMTKKYFDSNENEKILKIDSLHRSWQVDDGLLLPPNEAADKCMKLFKELLISSSMLDVVSSYDVTIIYDLHDFLHSWGAYSISSRIRSYIISVMMTSLSNHIGDNLFVHSPNDLDNEINFRLAERSLGSSGSGNTSGAIDSELAVYHLLSLPITVGFKTLKRCLPSAISGKEFGRLVTLASIGLKAAGAECLQFGQNTEPVFSAYSWKNQNKVYSQFRSLFTKAYFWKILHYFNVSFDPNTFEETSENIDMNNKSTIESEDPKIDILSSLILKASKVIKKCHILNAIVIHFADTFDLDKDIAIQCHIETTLKWPWKMKTRSEDTDKNSIFYLDQGIRVCNENVNYLLNSMSSREHRLLVLRKSIIALEANIESGKHFEFYSMILSIYQKELNHMMIELPNMSKFYSEDMEKLSRRLDTLAIISSYFEGQPYQNRPTFQQCFLPLNGDSDTVYCGVLGNRNVDNAPLQERMFDPLSPLLDCLLDEKSVSALAPLCASLGLPSGFIHARFLIQMIESKQRCGSSLPSLESYMVPIVKRLKNPKNGAEFAEWCANQYPPESPERLKCLEIAHDLAIRSSSEAERYRSNTINDSDEVLVLRERNALDVLKRISTSKSVLQDELLVINCLRQYEGVHSNQYVLQKLHLQIIQKVKYARVNDDDPEKFVEHLLVEGSLVASEASMNRKSGISDEIFNILSFSIHQACKLLEERYSHIDISCISKDITRHLLLHGDENINFSKTSISDTGFRNIIHHNNCPDEKDCDNLDLDLKEMTASKWSNEIKCSQNVIAAEEPSSFETPPHGREASEYSCARVGLRVAFILGVENNNQLENHAKELLDIIFAKTSTSIQKGLKRLCTNTFDSDRDNLGTKTLKKRTALTFIMRYRALRALSTLCERESIQSIIEEEKYVTKDDCSFSKCCFGLLLAKEIEAMRLSLPHSDLEQLSIMNHPSYARTLWKHIHHTHHYQSKGRFLLILVELILHEKGNQYDFQMLQTVLKEVLKLELPRTMLLICECLAAVNGLQVIFSVEKEIEHLVHCLCETLTKTIFNEIDEQKEEIDFDIVVSLLHRLGKAVLTFLENGLSSDKITFITMLCKFAEKCDIYEISYCIYDIALSISLLLSKAKMSEVFMLIKTTAVGSKVIEKKFGEANHYTTPNTFSNNNNSTCFEKLLALE